MGKHDWLTVQVTIRILFWTQINGLQNWITDLFPQNKSHDFLIRLIIKTYCDALNYFMNRMNYLSLLVYLASKLIKSILYIIDFMKFSIKVI